MSELSRGLRNNNPGNLRDFGIAWLGLTGRDAEGYCEFRTLVFGVRAMGVDFIHDIVQGHLNTIALLINSYAPSSENPTLKYRHFVSQVTGLDEDAELDPTNREQMLALARAITRFENGSAIVESLLEAGMDLAIGYCVKRGLIKLEGTTNA